MLLFNEKPTVQTRESRVNRRTVIVTPWIASEPSADGDLTRTAHVGEPSDRYVLVHETVERAVQAALDVARPGTCCADVDRAAREAIEAAGFGEWFVHRTGHGLGLTGHEPPSIMAGEERELVPGIVFTVEPGIYLPGEFGIRLEEAVAVTDDGCDILSDLPRDLVIR